MEITDFKASYLEIPFPEPGVETSAYGRLNSWGFTLVKIFTDEGIIGIGGQNTHRAGGRYFSKILNEAIKPLLLEKIVDPHNVRQFQAYLQSLKPSSNLAPRPCSVEMALWDIIGKSVKKPIYKLLGARQDKVKAYINTTTKAPRWEPDEIADFAVKYLEKGYRGIKINIYNTKEVHKDIDGVKAIRRAVGDDMDIMVDAQASISPWSVRTFSYRAALKIALELEKQACLWLEDIIPYMINPDLCKRFADEVDILIASGGQLFGAHTFEALMRDNVLDVVQPDVMHVGGISELVLTASLAEMYNKMCCPHTGYVPGLVSAATLQATGSTNIPYIENVLEPMATLETRDNILMEPIEIGKDGYIKISQKPGIGVELNEKNVEKFIVN
ncbi:mandelate racemase/muconate lactonizing enzyme family protein [Thermoproteota archaeon]